MWNNYTVELQNRGRIEDHLAEARADALEAEARAADPRVSRLTLAVRRTIDAAARRIGATRRRAAARAGAARQAVAGRALAARRWVALEARRVRHLHPHRPAWIHHRA